MERFCDATLPLRVTLSVGIPGSLEGIASIALFEPADEGVKVTWMAQVPNAAMVWPVQVSVPLINSAALFPDTATVPITRPAVPELVTVKV
jgi:hypothetical protein